VAAGDDALGLSASVRFITATARWAACDKCKAILHQAWIHLTSASHLRSIWLFTPAKHHIPGTISLSWSSEIIVSTHPLPRYASNVRRSSDMVKALSDHNLAPDAVIAAPQKRP
jgi:hypothetical protein